MKEALFIKEFKDGIKEMTREDKELWLSINNRLLHELNEKEFKTKTGYRSASQKIYGNTIKEYQRRKAEQIDYKTLHGRVKDALDYTDNLTLQEEDFVLDIVHMALKANIDKTLKAKKS